MWRAKLKEDGTLPHDKNGKPIFEPNLEKGTLHYETGYMLAYKFTVGTDTTTEHLAKFLIIPRGYLLLSEGTY